MQFTSTPLNRSREPFSSSVWVFELKYDGFVLLVVEFNSCLRSLEQS
jgi:hypothetical protein